MLYKLNNGLGKIKLGWTERTLKNDNDNYEREIEYLRHNPDSKLEDIIEYGNKYDERYIKKELEAYRLDAPYVKEWYDGSDPVILKKINQVWLECKKRVAERVILENEIYRENHPELFND